MTKPVKLKVGSKAWWKDRLDLVYGVIPPAMVESILGKKEATKFFKWMGGQTMSMHGYYPHDLETYIEAKMRGQKDPTVYD